MATAPTDFAAERNAMVERQLRRRGITEPDILDAFRAVPREAFVGKEYAHLAYGDHPLPIEAGQTISQPYIVALMIQATAIKASDKVLEVGSGSGYAAAVIGRIARKVVGIERQHDLVEVARERLDRLGLDQRQPAAAPGPPVGRRQVAVALQPAAGQRDDLVHRPAGRRLGVRDMDLLDDARHAARG